MLNDIRKEVRGPPFFMTDIRDLDKEEYIIELHLEGGIQNTGWVKQ
jgi:hypothetical protein